MNSQPILWSVEDVGFQKHVKIIFISYLFKKCVFALVRLDWPIPCKGMFSHTSAHPSGRESTNFALLTWTPFQSLGRFRHSSSPSSSTPPNPSSSPPPPPPPRLQSGRQRPTRTTAGKVRKWWLTFETAAFQHRELMKVGISRRNLTWNLNFLVELIRF